MCLERLALALNLHGKNLCLAVLLVGSPVRWKLEIVMMFFLALIGSLFL